MPCAVKSKDLAAPQLYVFWFFADTFHMGETRREPRTPVMMRAEVLWTDEAGGPRTIPVTIEDRSTGGACLRIATPIPPGAKLEIKARKDTLSGTVVYCRPDRREYVLGIRLEARENHGAN
jgi:PilZ domain